MADKPNIIAQALIFLAAYLHLEKGQVQRLRQQQQDMIRWNKKWWWPFKESTELIDEIIKDGDKRIEAIEKQMLEYQAYIDKHSNTTLP